MIAIEACLPDILTYLGRQNGPLVVVDCGLMPYQPALDLQLALNQAVLDESIPSVILFVEHPPVITLGIHKDHNLLLSTPELLKTQGVECVPIRRGGGSTAHNPGQLVLYPIVSLSALGFRVAPFVHYLEQVGMDVLLAAGVKAERRNRYPGLWVEGRKIASVGVQITRGVSMHGIAINLCNDLGIFDHIIPCGITGVEMTSALRERGLCPPMADSPTKREERKHPDGFIFPSECRESEVRYTAPWGGKGGNASAFQGFSWGIDTFHLKTVAEQSCLHHLPPLSPAIPSATTSPTPPTPPDQYPGETS